MQSQHSNVYTHKNSFSMRYQSMLPISNHTPYLWALSNFFSNFTDFTVWLRLFHQVINWERTKHKALHPWWQLRWNFEFSPWNVYILEWNKAKKNILSWVSAVQTRNHLKRIGVESDLKAHTTCSGNKWKCCWHLTFSKSFNRSSFSLMLISKACLSFCHSSCIFNDKLISASTSHK